MYYSLFETKDSFHFVGMCFTKKVVPSTRKASNLAWATKGNKQLSNSVNDGAIKLKAILWIYILFNSRYAYHTVFASGTLLQKGNKY